MPYTPEEAYQQLKSIEPLCPLLGPRETIIVGTIAASTGAFEWAVPLHTFNVNVPVPSGTGPGPEPAAPGHSIQLSFTAGLVNPNSIFVTLRFKIANPHGVLGVRTDSGLQTEAPEGQDYLDLNLGNSLHPGGNFIDCTLFGPIPDTTIKVDVLAPPTITAGAFTIPALPLSLVYAPPQPTAGSASKITSQLTSSSSTSHTVETSVGSTNNSKTATAYTPSDFLSKIASAISDVATIAGVFASPDSGSGGDTSSSWAKPLTAFLNLLSGILSQTTESTLSGYSVTTDNKSTVTVTDAVGYQTTPGFGPGVGDLFIYLYNVRVAWIAYNGSLGITVLTHSGQASNPAQDLQNGVAPLDATTCQALLQLDPFVGTPPYHLDPSRFVPSDVQPQLQYGPPQTSSFTVSYTISSEDKSVEVQTTTTITDYKPGWLTALFGDNQTVENTMTTTYTTTDDTTSSTTVSQALNVSLAPGSLEYTVDVWYDRLFGNLAYVTPGDEAPIIIHPIPVPIPKVQPPNQK
ncbi:MAG TPA: hypothetical protein VNG51_21555 [Ktedonobacteraceae bacterium]|nr:hypothetical protein [Ktedonobacteraceae bacterium]